MVKKHEQELILDMQARIALERAITNLKAYIMALSENDTLKVQHAQLIRNMDNLRILLNDLNEKSKELNPIHPEDIARVTNAFINVNEQLKQAKFEDPKGKMIEKLGVKVFPDAKPIQEAPAQQKMDVLQNNILKMGENINRDLQTVTKHANPKQRSWWQKFKDACHDFVKTCVNILMKLIGKRKKEIIKLSVQPGMLEDRVLQKRAAELPQGVQLGNIMQDPAAKQVFANKAQERQKKGFTDPLPKAKAKTSLMEAKIQQAKGQLKPLKDADIPKYQKKLNK